MRGKSESSLTSMAALFVGFAMLVVLLVAIFAFASRQAMMLDDLRRSAGEPQLLNQIGADLVDAETGRRGYLLTGDRSYLDPYHAALTRDEDDFKGLADVAASDGDARGEIDALGGLADGKLAEPRRTIDLYSAGKADQALALVQTGAGKAIMEATGA